MSNTKTAEVEILIDNIKNDMVEFVHPDMKNQSKENIGLAAIIWNYMHGSYEKSFSNLELLLSEFAKHQSKGMYTPEEVKKMVVKASNDTLQRLIIEANYALSNRHTKTIEADLGYGERYWQDNYEK